MDTSNCTTKVCTKCGKEFPATTEYFGVKSDRPDGLYSMCRHCKNISDKQWRDNNPNYNDTHNAASKQWRDNNPDRRKEIKARSYKRHKSSVKEYDRKWRTKNPEKSRAIWRRHNALKKNARGTHTGEDIRLLLASQKGLCWWCGKPVGDDYHVDHRVPLARGGSNAPENLCISCPSCNTSKGAKMPSEWIGRLL